MKIKIKLQDGDLNYGDKVLVGHIEATYLCTDLVGNPIVQAKGHMAYTAKWSFLSLPDQEIKGRMLEAVSGYGQPFDANDLQPDETRMVRT